MIKQFVKCCISILTVGVVVLQTTGCDQIPVRNPFAGRPEPKLSALPVTTDSTLTAKILWSTNALAKQERFTKLNPVANGQFIFAADHTGKVVAIDSQHGKKIWQTNTKNKFSSGPTLVEGKLLLATSDAKIVALAPSDGQILWEAKVSSEVLASPAGEKGLVLVHAIDGSVTALNSKNGEKIWQVDQSTPSLTLHYSSAPVVSGDMVLVGFSTGKLLALNLQSGLIEWERTISLPRGRSELQRMVDISADPLVAEGNAYVITYQGKLAAVNIATGDLLWEREISSYHNMAISGNQLFVTDNDHALWAIDRETGATLWKQTTLAERYITGPAVVGDTVVVGDLGGYLHFLSVEKGTLLSRLEFSGKIYQDPIAMGQRIIVNSHRGKVAAVMLAAEGHS